MGGLPSALGTLRSAWETEGDVRVAPTITGVRGPRRHAPLLLLSALLLSACSSSAATSKGSTTSGTVIVTPLTADGTDAYTVLRKGSILDMSAPATNARGNLRVAVVPSGAPVTTDERSCATWTSETNSEFDQEGLVLRLAPSTGGSGMRAITVTKNVEYNFTWVFNVHLWDTSQANRFKLLGQLNLWHALAAKPPKVVHSFPWHVCARVAGSTLQVMVWAGDDPQPSWTDAAHVSRLTLPHGWAYPGQAGWYIGHLHPGDHVSYTDLQTATSSDAPTSTTSLP